MEKGLLKKMKVYCVNYHQQGQLRKSFIQSASAENVASLTLLLCNDSYAMSSETVRTENRLIKS